MDPINERIHKDIVSFGDRLSGLKDIAMEKKEKEIVELATLYSKDAEDWMDKGDLYTAFASISYAHGLLDAILKLKNAE